MMSFSVCEHVAMLRVIPLFKDTFFLYNMAPKPKELVSADLQLKRESGLCFNMGENGLCCIHSEVQFYKVVKEFSRVFLTI